MTAPKTNENCHYLQNDLHKCKIKLEKFHFDILCRFGVIKESLPGGIKDCTLRGLFSFYWPFCEKALTMKVDKTCKIRCLEEVPINAKDKKLFFGYVYRYSKIKTWGNAAFCSN